MKRFSEIFLLLILFGAVLTGCGSAASTPVVTVTLADQPPTLDETDSVVDAAATAIVGEATETALAITQNPALAQAASEPELPALCTPGIFNQFSGALSEAAQNALIAAGVNEAVAGVITIQQTEDCTSFTTLETLISINVPVQSLTDDQALGALAGNILEALRGFPPEAVPPSRVMTLSLRFDRGTNQRALNLDYPTAVEAFASGLRGTELIQRLGALSQTR